MNYKSNKCRWTFHLKLWPIAIHCFDSFSLRIHLFTPLTCYYWLKDLTSLDLILFFSFHFIHPSRYFLHSSQNFQLFQLHKTVHPVCRWYFRFEFCSYNTQYKVSCSFNLTILKCIQQNFFFIFWDEKRWKQMVSCCRPVSFHFHN